MDQEAKQSKTKNISDNQQPSGNKRMWSSWDTGLALLVISGSITATGSQLQFSSDYQCESSPSY